MDNAINESIILAGGFGMRLKPVVHELPKPMANICGKPFLEYLLYFLQQQGCRRCVLSVGYKHEIISNFFGQEYFGMKLFYAIENEPLGTGGGIKNCLHFIKNNNFFLLNGDSFFDIDLKKLSDFHVQHESAITLSLKEMKNVDRYGTLEISNHKVICFNEKKKITKGLINGGVYVVSKSVFSDENLGEKFSFEKDILEVKIGKQPIFSLLFDGYFIDIGIPEDYQKAQSELEKITCFQNKEFVNRSK